MDQERLDDISGVAALDHPISRAAYQLVVDRGWVSRDAAALAMDLSRSVAAFHLDKLAGAGLLDVRYERTSGRTGPGSGRPAKLYGRSAREITVSLPPRRYDVAGALLADAVERAEQANIPVKQAVGEVARRTGREAAGASGKRGREAVMQSLRQRGYEPRKRGREIALLNCPFHALAVQHRDLVCGMNLELLTGLLEGVTGVKLRARPEPEPGYCCVRVAPAGQ